MKPDSVDVDLEPPEDNFEDGNDAENFDAESDDFEVDDKAAPEPTIVPCSLPSAFEMAASRSFFFIYALLVAFFIDPDP
jgi:hypothetical protein